MTIPVTSMHTALFSTQAVLVLITLYTCIGSAPTTLHVSIAYEQLTPKAAFLLISRISQARPGRARSHPGLPQARPGRA